MPKNILVISTTLRKGGNSDILAAEFARGAQAAGNTVEIIHLRGKYMEFCLGCLACQKTNVCVIEDDVNEILEKMRTSDVIAFATPIYFYEMCGQMKTLLDRSNPLFPQDYAFRDIYLLATAADEDTSAMDGAQKGLKGWVACFEKAKLAGIIKGLGATDVGEIKRSSEVMHAAYEMGRGTTVRR